MKKHLTYKNLMLTLAFMAVAMWSYNIGTINTMIIDAEPRQITENSNGRN